MANHIEWWEAQLVDGAMHRSSTIGAGLEPAVTRARKVTVKVEGHDDPFSASCIPEHGESLRVFTRTARNIAHAVDSQLEQPPADLEMPVIEIAKHNVSLVVMRLYIHPHFGPIFSSLDLQL